MNIFNDAQKKVADQATKTEKSVGSLDDAFKAISPSTLSAVAGITALIGTVKALTGFFKQATANFAHFEEMQMGLETFYHDADKAKAKFEELRKLSNETTFGVDELTNAFTQMANVGVNTDTIEQKLTMLGNIAQGDKTKFAELVSIYSKIQSTGKASSMQMQQLRLRGLPIDDMLRKMGKTGTATAKDITKAFENMTAEIDETTGKAGQFYNAMDNINKTMNGKEGFISDYFKEFSVNFAEISGLADAYKNILDALKGAIGAVSDKLLEWNKNPVAKALFQGTMVAIIGGLVTGIGIGLVGAIKKMNTELLKTVVLKSILDPKTLAIAVGVGAIAGVTVGILAYNKNLKKAQEETEKLNKETQRLAEAWQNNGTRTDKLDYAKNNLAIMETGYAKQLEDIKAVEQQVKDLNEEYSTLEKKGYKSTRDMLRMGTIGNQKKSLLDELDQMQKRYLATNEIIEKQRKLVQGLQDEYDDATQLETLKKDFSNIYQNSLPSDEKEKVALQEQLDTVLAYQEKLKKLNGKQDNNGNIIDYDKEKANIDKTINYLNNKLKGLSSWKDIFKNVTGIKVGNGVGNKSAGQVAGEDYSKMIDKEIEIEKQFKGMFNPSLAQEFADVYDSEMTRVVNDISKLMKEKNVDNPFTTDDETIKAMVNKYGELMQKKNEQLAVDYATAQKNAEKVRGLYNAYGINKTTRKEQLSNELANWKTKVEPYASKGDAVPQWLLDEGKKLKDSWIELGYGADNLSDILGNTADVSKSFPQMLEDMIQTAGNRLKDGIGDAGDVGNYIGAYMGQQLVANSGDASNFLEGFQNGGVWGGVIEMLLGAIINVAKGFDNFDKVMNPITNMMQQAKPALEKIFNSLEAVVDDLAIIGTIFNEIINVFYPLIQMINDSLTNIFEGIYAILQVLQPLISVLRVFGNLMRLMTLPINALLKGANALAIWLSNAIGIGEALSNAADQVDDAVDEFYNKMNKDIDTWSELDKVKQKVAENEEQRMKDLTGEYTNLLNAMKENEEWYIHKKTELNANTRKEGYQSVNDMILTPQGNFSTNPNDYIIATKNPNSLGGAVVNVNIQNNASNDVDVKATTTTNANGMQEIMIAISRKIANDVSNGANGWDLALASQQSRMSGRNMLL